MPSSDPVRRIRDIVAFCSAIETYTAGMAFAEFVSDTKTYHAVCYCLLVISEATTKLGPFAAELAPDQPWHAIRALGNVLRHEYDGLDDGTIWKIVTQNIKPLRLDAEAAIAKLTKRAH